MSQNPQPCDLLKNLFLLLTLLSLLSLLPLSLSKKYFSLLKILVSGYPLSLSSLLLPPPLFFFFFFSFIFFLIFFLSHKTKPYPHSHSLQPLFPENLRLFTILPPFSASQYLVFSVIESISMVSRICKFGSVSKN